MEVDGRVTDCSDCAVVQQLLDSPTERGVAELVIDHRGAVGCFGRGCEGARILGVGGEGFVDEDVLAGGEGVAAEVEVHVGRRVDGDGVELGSVEQRCGFVGGEGDFEALGDGGGALGFAAPESGDLPAGGAEGGD